MVSLMALQTMAPCLVARKVNFSNAGYHKREGFAASDAFCREVIRVPICNRLALRSPDFQFFIKTGKQHTYPIHEAMNEEFGAGVGLRWDIHIVRGPGTSATCWPASQSCLAVLVYVQLYNPLTYGCFTTMVTLRNFGLLMTP